MNLYLVFKDNYVGENGETEYPHGVKFAIKYIKDGYYYFLGEKIEIKLKNELYTTGEIVNQ